LKANAAVFHIPYDYRYDYEKLSDLDSERAYLDPVRIIVKLGAMLKSADSSDWRAKDYRRGKDSR
jgi:hypothetical protein